MVIGGRWRDVYRAERHTRVVQYYSGKLGAVYERALYAVIGLPRLRKSSPSCNRSGYDLIATGARSAGFDTVKLLHWPGHVAQDSVTHGELTFRSALDIGLEKFQEWKSQGLPFTLFARSFGTLIAAKVLADEIASNLDRVTLWAPPSFTAMWSLFSKDMAETTNNLRRKGTYLGAGFFASLEPFEVNFAKLPYPTIVVTGSEDQYCPPNFREYLNTLVVGKRNFEFREVEGAAHEVDDRCTDKVRTQYVEQLFAN